MGLAELQAAEALLALSQSVSLQTSNDKRQAKEHKVLLERRDDQVKNMLTMCMRTIKDMNTEPLLYGSSSSSIELAGPSTAPDCMQTSETSSDSEEDESALNKLSNLAIERAPVKTAAQLKHLTDNIGRIEAPVNGENANLKRKRLARTTLPQNSVTDRPKSNDQGTQTDLSHNNVAILPAELVMLFKTKLVETEERFQRLVASARPVPDDSAYNSGGDESRGNDSERENVPEPTAEETGQNKNNSNVGARNVQVRRVSAHTTNSTDNSDMVPLGSGRASVPARLMKDINWDSYTSATRQLLLAVFSRKVLATHSLTGKQSPAFTNKPAKKSLDPELVEDIVQTVSQRCRVPKRAVRACITIKCTDEAKLFRNRMQARVNNADRQPAGQPSMSHENDENSAPSTGSRRSHSSTESSSLSA